jgi:hypothetical protein
MNIISIKKPLITFKTIFVRTFRINKKIIFVTLLKNDDKESRSR